MNKNVKDKPANVKNEGKSNSNTRKGHSSKKDYDNSYVDKRFKRQALNDASWYARSPELLRDTASFPYGRPLAALINYGSEAGALANSTAIPGLMTIMKSPHVGYTDNPNSAINVAAREVYSEVRKANSGARNYNSPDMMLYLVSMMNIYSFIEWMKRVYGSMYISSYTNWYAPGALTYAQGVSYTNLISNSAQFRAYINGFVTRVRKFAVPLGFPVMQKWIWMYQNFYTDTPDNDKAQIYMYNPEGFYKFTYDSGSAGALVFEPLVKFKVNSEIVEPTSSDWGLTLSDIMQYGENLLYNIIENEDHAIMTGDILKAYTTSRCYMPQPIQDTYSVAPVYAEEILDQINNLTLCGRKLAPRMKTNDTPLANNGVIQSRDGSPLERGYLISKPTFYLYDTNPEIFSDTFSFEGIVNSVYRASKLVNFTHGNIQPSDTMVATRLSNIASYSTHNEVVADEEAFIRKNNIIPYLEQTSNVVRTFVQEFDTIGTEVATYAKMFYYALPNRGTSNPKSLIVSDDIYTVIPTLFQVNTSIPNQDPSVFVNQYANTIQQIADDHRRMALISMFYRAPFLYPVHAYDFYYFVLNDNEYARSHAYGNELNNAAVGDVNYYTVLDAEDLRNMTATALLSEFSMFAM